MGGVARLQDFGASRKTRPPFLERIFQQPVSTTLTWWVNRKDIAGKQVFSGGFLGLDNIGLFDRSKPLPNGSVLEQADGSAWMAFYRTTMLADGAGTGRRGPRV